MRVAAYVRVSSRSQDTRTQISEISRCARARGDYVATWFEEKRSGKGIERPILAKIRTEVQAGRVKRLYVYRLDRLTRSGIRDTLALVDEFQTCGCELVSVSDGFLLEGPGRDVVLAVIGWAAQMERLAIGERIASARKRVEANGGHWGRPRAAIDKVVWHVRAQRLRGLSIRAIATELKMARSTVAAILAEKGPYAKVRKLAAKKRARAKY